MIKHLFQHWASPVCSVSEEPIIYWAYLLLQLTTCFETRCWAKTLYQQSGGSRTGGIVGNREGFPRDGKDIQLSVRERVSRDPVWKSLMQYIKMWKSFKFMTPRKFPMFLSTTNLHGASHLELLWQRINCGKMSFRYLP